MSRLEASIDREPPMKRAQLLMSTVVLILSACSSSSSGPASSPPPPGANPAGLVVATTNAKPAVRVAYGATIGSVGTGGLVGDSGIASSPGGFQKPGLQSSLSTVLARVVQKVPLGPDTFDCGVSGTQTISGSLASLFTLTAGDRIDVEATDCDDGLGEVINGRMEMTVVIFSGDIASLYLLEMGVVLIDFEVVTATDTVVSNGDSLVAMDTLGNPMILMSISGNSLATTSSAGTDTLTNFSTSQSVNTSVQPEPYTLDSSGTVDSSKLTGFINYSTPVVFQGAGTAYPYAGELLIAGDSGGTIRLIALDEVNVRIETDTDGDGTVDATEDTTWDDIAF